MPSLFDHLNNLTRNKIFPDFSDEEISKSYDCYMINRFLSFFEIWLPIVQVLNQTKNLTKEAHYRFLFNVLPKTYVSFNNYIKKKKDTSEEQKILIMRYFNFSKSDLNCALDVLTEKQIEDICDKFKSGKVR